MPYINGPPSTTSPATSHPAEPVGSSYQMYEGDPKESLPNRDDEFTTLLYKASAIFNSRPLTIVETHSGDGVTPSPGHFLTRGPISCVPGS